MRASKDARDPSDIMPRDDVFMPMRKMMR